MINPEHSRKLVRDDKIINSQCFTLFFYFQSCSYIYLSITNLFSKKSSIFNFIIFIKENMALNVYQ